MVGDRLEPGPLLADVAAFDNCIPPFSVTFWRVAEETCTHHRNPLFLLGTGVTLFTLGVDWLHCLSKGVFQFFLGPLVRDLLNANAWGLPGVGFFDMGIYAMRGDLWSWYERESKNGRNWTRLQQLTPAMLGTQTHVTFNLHGSETNGFLNFAVFLVGKYGVCLGPKLPFYSSGLRSLVSAYDIIKQHPDCNLKPPAINAFVAAVCGHLQSLKSLNISYKPKHHMFMEMGARLSAFVQ